MTDRSLEDVLALPQTVCESEPIHRAPGIHPSSALIIIKANTLAVVSYSENILDLLALDNIEHGASITKTLPELDIEPKDLNQEPFVLQSFITELGPGKNRFGVVIHPAGPHALVELFPQALDDLKGGVLDEASVSGRLFGAVRNLRKTFDLQSLANLAAEEIRRITHYDRVLVYRFDKEGHGRVIGEALTPDWDDSFMGFCFPESDIPAQARALYCRSVLRYLPYGDYEPVKLVPAQDPSTNNAFDIGLAWGRSQSPIHLMYQKNLGVDGAMSISIMEGDRLWGLVVCHHRTPHPVAFSAMLMALNISEAFSMQYGDVEHVEENQARLEHSRLHQALLEQISGSDDLFDSILKGPVTLDQLFYASSSAALVFKGFDDKNEVLTIGDAPPKDAIIEYSTWIKAEKITPTAPIHVTDCISEEYPAFTVHAEKASGVLVCAIGEELQYLLIWFRPEIVQTITWGGNPYEKAAGTDTHPILPRKSFERWVEVKRRHSRPWPSWKFDIAESLRNAFNDVILRQLRSIRHLNEQLAHSNRIKSDFLANMSHELRTPLNAILGFSEAMKSEVLGALGNPKYREYVQDINNSGQQLLGLVNDILDISALNVEELALQEQDCGLQDIVTAVLRLVKGRAESGQVRLNTDIIDSQIVLKVDVMRTKKILTNLLINAIKFTPAKGQVDLTGFFDAEGNYIVQITDTGIGMDKQDLSKALQAFGKVEDNKYIPNEGSGLGLPLTKAFVELHGGTLTLASTKGQGTKVTVRIPKERVVSSEA